MLFNDLLAEQKIDPAGVLVFRHTPSERGSQQKLHRQHCVSGIRNFDIDLKLADARSAIHAYLHGIAVDRDMPGDDGQDLFSQGGQ
jgi:hypothetical protein